jgi:hypothetical protein
MGAYGQNIKYSRMVKIVWSEYSADGSVPDRKANVSEAISAVICVAVGRQLR